MCYQKESQTLLVCYQNESMFFVASLSVCSRALSACSQSLLYEGQPLGLLLASSRTALGLHSACFGFPLVLVSSLPLGLLSSLPLGCLSACSQAPLGCLSACSPAPFWSALKPFSAKSVASLSVCVTFLHVRLLCSSFRRSPEWLRPGYQRIERERVKNLCLSDRACYPAAASCLEPWQQLERGRLISTECDPAQEESQKRERAAYGVCIEDWCSIFKDQCSCSPTTRTHADGAAYLVQPG